MIGSCPDLISEVIEQSPYPEATRRFLSHVIRLQMGYGDRYADGVPITRDCIRELPGAPRDRTEDVWRTAVEAEVLDVEEYVPRKRCRVFRYVGPPLVNLPVEQREKPLRQVLTFDGVHSWKQRNFLIYSVLRCYRSGRGLINLKAYEAHVESLEDPNTKANELRVLGSITRQGPVQAKDMPLGILEYKQVYEARDNTGRMECISGGQQSSGLGKTAMYSGIPNVYNYDIRSCGPSAVLTLFEDAINEDAQLNIEILRDYPGKEVLQNRYGIDARHFKIAEYAVMNGASFYADTVWDIYFDARKRAAKKWDGRRPVEELALEFMPALVCIAFEMSGSSGLFRADECYSLLKRIYKPMSRECAKWRKWLITSHWNRHKVRGRRRGGHFVRNACGLPFNMLDYGATSDDWQARRSRGKKYASHLIFGLERAFMMQITLLGPDYGFEVVSDEHDGAVTIGAIPPEAVVEARRRSGFRTAELKQKPFKQ